MTVSANSTVTPTIAPSIAASNTGTSGSSSSGSNDVLTFTQNFNTFLTLLTTQLQNQDPLSPMDTNTFTQQLVSFSEVEQQIDTNNNLQSLIQLQTAGETISATPLVGDTIQYNAAQAPLTDGQVTWSYSLPTAATQATLVVEDSNGNVVYTTPANTNAGTSSFTWDGQTNSGEEMPNGGIYTLQVVATDSSNNPITATVQSTGTVTGVSVNGGQATFDVSGVTVPMSELVTVNPTQSASSTN